MASKKTGTPKMIVPYEWILENVGQEPATIASKMILFRGEKVFRVGLKNHAKSPILFLMAIDLGKIGMKVQDVTYGIQGSDIGPAKMTQMINDNIGYGGNLQLFTINLAEKVLGNCTFMFRICIVGTNPGYYSYQLSDRLAKDQLWATLKSQPNLPDVEFIVKDKTFPVHKAILAARSRVFAAEFEKKQLGVPDQIRLDGVEPSTVEKFLHFIYTGEPMGTLADEKLMELSDRYGLTTLTSLCKVALKKIVDGKMEKVRKRLNDNDEELYLSKIIPEIETEIFFDRTTFRCSTLPLLTLNSASEYQTENICVAYYKGEKKETFSKRKKRFYISKPEIHLFCTKQQRFAMKVTEDVYCSQQQRHPQKTEQHWLKMESKNYQKNAEGLDFVAQLDWDVYLDEVSHAPLFDVKVVSTIVNYYYEMMDNDWLKDFWVAATNQKLTDVEIFVGTVKVMEAHRFILSARSPVLNESLNKIHPRSNNAWRSIVTFGAEFDVEIVKNFLNFLYTGSLKAPYSVPQLCQLAIMYEVETLKNMCQHTYHVPYELVEELTDYLIQF